MAASGSPLKKRERTDCGYHGYFADPYGHIREVAYNPGVPIGEDGRPTLL